MDTELSTANLRLMYQEFAKLDRFDGQNYTRWADKVKFMLVVLKLGYVMEPNFTPIPVNLTPMEGKPVDPKLISDLEKQRSLCRESEELCVGHIKNS